MNEVLISNACSCFDLQEVTGVGAGAGVAAGTEEDASRRSSRARRLNLTAVTKVVMLMTVRTQVRKRRAQHTDMELRKE